MQNSKRLISYMLCFVMTFAMLPMVFIPVSAADAFVVTVSGRTSTTAPDGQSAYILPLTDGARITANNLGNLSACENMYFVFDVYTGGATMPVAGDFVITKQNGSGGWWGQEAHFFSVSKAAASSNWTTFYTRIDMATARIESGKPVNLDILKTVNQLGFNLSANGWSGEFLIKNPRFQDNPYSASVPELINKTQTSLTVKAAAYSGQEIEFAINADNSVAGVAWKSGILSDGGYLAEFDGLQSGGDYYVFARTVANPNYNFTGTAYSAKFTMDATDDAAVAIAKAALTWNVIANGNASQDEVTVNLNFPTAGASGTTIAWYSDKPEFINSAGIVTRPQTGFDENVKLTAEIMKGLAYDTVEFYLTVKTDVTDMSAVNETAAAITWDAIRSVNTSQTNVTAGLTLSTATTNGTAITWSSSNNDVINAINGRSTSQKELIPGGAVFRQDTETTVTLTATVRRGDASRDVQFELTVPAADTAACEVTINGPGIGNYTANGISISSGGDGTAPTMNYFNATSGWTIRPSDYMYVWIDNPIIKQASKVQVEIQVWRAGANPSFQVQYCSSYAGSDEGTSYALYRGIDVTTSGSAANQFRTITVTLDRCNFNLKNAQGNPIGQNKKAQFRITNNGANLNIKSIKITAVPLTDTEAVEVAKSALTWDSIKGDNVSQSAVTENLTLLTAGQLDTDIVWVSSNPEVISADGVVTRRSDDVNVNLTATISRALAGTGSSDTQSFTIVVIGNGSDYTDEEAVMAMKESLTWDVIKSGNFWEDKVTTNLNLPKRGAGATDIAWSSSDSGVISADGIVTRDADLDKNVTLTAKITRGAASDTAVFNLTVAGISNLIASLKPTIETVYPTKDYVVSDFNVRDYGAKTVDEDPTFDNRLVFQAAIDAAYNDGGGVVWIPAGHYAFRSENNNGVVLDLKQSVQLRGDWISPEDNGGKVEGTVLEVYAGRGRGLDRNNSNGTNGCFISMVQGTGVTNLSVWYPEQTIYNPTPYPWTLKQVSGDSATVENVTLVNSWGGFRASPAELHYVYNSYITALEVGVEIHTCTDIGRIENVRIDPKYWAGSGLLNAPSYEDVRAYTRANARGFGMHRSDWEYLSDLYISGYKEGMWIGREPGGTDTPNAQFYRMHMEDCGTALYVDAVNPYGLLISDSIFRGTGDESRAAYFSSSFNTSVQFNTVDFEGPIVSDGNGGVISFENCTFNYSGYDLTINRGSVLLGNSSFSTADKHVYLGKSGSNGVDTFKSVNSGFNRVLDYVNDSVSSTKVEVYAGNDQYNVEPIDRTIKTDIEIQPKAAQGVVLRAELPCAKGFNNNVPTVDVSGQLQAMLDAVGNAGGGIVYLPGGRYLIDKPIVIPSGVELRGTRDVQSHIQGGGSAIFTNYGINQPDAAPLIRLEASAGIRGLHIAQLGQKTGAIGTTADSFYECPFLIQGLGSDVYIINITMPNADKGIDLATYKTDRHYVEYFAGSCARAGIWVGGGADGGFIRNWQGNPHYGQRFPQGNQGYPNLSLADFQRSWYSSIKLGDVTNETIFFNFVFGSKNGIHFLKDEITGNNPKDITVIGHGTDGSTYGMFVEDADADTKIVLINSELVTISYAGRMAYVLMGGDSTVESDPDRVHKDARLILYNTALWGGANIAAIVNSGNLYMYQTNFSAFSSAYGVQVNGGKAYVYDSYFRPGGKTHIQITSEEGRAELTNNYYTGGMKNIEKLAGSISGSDILPFTVEFVKDGLNNRIKITHVIRDEPVGGVLRMCGPKNYADNFTPIIFDALDFNESCIVDLPYYMSGAPFEFELTLDNGRVFKYTQRFDVTFADHYEGENSLESGTVPLVIIDSASQANEGPWSGVNDLSMAGSLKWDVNNLYLYLVVKDDVNYNTRTGSTGSNSMEQIWNADSVQVAVNMNKGASDGGQSRTSELGFGLNSQNGSVLTWRWAAPAGAGSAGAFNPANSNFKITRDENAKTTAYDLIIPWASLIGSGEIDMTKLGISILVNDIDEQDGARLAMEYGTGLNVKSYPNLTDLHLLDAGQYNEMIIEAAKKAVEKALLTGLKSDISGAYNFIGILADDEDVKIELIEKLAEVALIKIAEADPTCTEDGYIKYYNVVTGQTAIVGKGSALGHYSVWEEYDVYKAYKCQRCGEVEKIIYLNFAKASTSSKSISIVEKTKNVWDLTFTVVVPYEDGKEKIIVHTIKIGKNSDGIIDLGNYKLKYDIKGNGSNIKAFEIVKK